MISPEASRCVQFDLIIISVLNFENNTNSDETSLGCSLVGCNIFYASFQLFLKFKSSAPSLKSVWHQKQAFHSNLFLYYFLFNLLQDFFPLFSRRAPFTGPPFSTASIANLISRFAPDVSDLSLSTVVLLVSAAMMPEWRSYSIIAGISFPSIGLDKLVYAAEFQTFLFSIVLLVQIRSSPTVALYSLVGRYWRYRLPRNQRSALHWAER